MRKRFIAGNWKMYKTTKEALAFAQGISSLKLPSDVVVAIAAPFTQLAALKEALSGSGVRLAAQNMHFEDEGAYTGEISAPMLAEIGVDYCIIGHSERRQHFGETDETVNKKLKKAIASGIKPICCVGESLEIRDGGEAQDYVASQIQKAFSGIPGGEAVGVTVAYEPIWAIGTGRTATPEQAGDMCSHIRHTLGTLYGTGVSEKIIIQYGGSVKPDNASALMNTRDIDGALVGGASLVLEDFWTIILA
ncbi:MAG: triose-phosphate isomerase [Anaerovoracaceae bacterium]